VWGNSKSPTQFSILVNNNNNNNNNNNSKKKKNQAPQQVKNQNQLSLILDILTKTN
jgi:hypothetical protein